MMNRLSHELLSLASLFRAAARDVEGTRFCDAHGELDCQGFTSNRDRRVAYRLSVALFRLANAADVIDMRFRQIRQSIIRSVVEKLRSRTIHPAIHLARQANVHAQTSTY